MVDPVSAFLATYLTVITTNVQQNVSDVLGTTTKNEYIYYEGMNISFQYQIWKIKDKSVCASLSNGDQNYSMCTVKAKSFFTDVCKELSKRNDLNWKGVKIKRMYCNASISYKPVIATISSPNELTERRKIEKQCNLLILKAMENNDEELIAERDLVCGKR